MVIGIAADVEFCDYFFTFSEFLVIFFFQLIVGCPVSSDALNSCGYGFFWPSLVLSRDFLVYFLVWEKVGGSTSLNFSSPMRQESSTYLTFL